MKKLNIFLLIIISFLYSCKYNYFYEDSNYLVVSIPDKNFKVMIEPERKVYYNYMDYLGRFSDYKRLRAVAFFEAGITLGITFSDNIDDHIRNAELQIYPNVFKRDDNNQIQNYTGDIYICNFNDVDHNGSDYSKAHKILYIIKDGWLLEFHASIPNYSLDKEHIFDEIFRCISIEEEK